MRKIELLFLTILIIFGFAVRLYRFDNPIADWHSWRQADTSSVSRNFVQNGFDLLHPHFDDLSNVASGFDNPQGYRFVEFPIYNFFQAGLFKLIGVVTLEEWGRLVTIFSSVLSSVFIFLIVKKHQGFLAGAGAAFFFAFIPYNIYYGRTILPDPSMAMASLAGIYFFDKWLDEKSKLQLKSTIFFITSLILTASALLLKPYALFFTLPMIYLAFNNSGFSIIKKWQLWLFMVLAIIPLVAWRMWMTQFPSGIPVSDWLFNSGDIRFKGAFFYWLFADRVGRLILGYWGLIILGVGFLAKTKKEDFFFFLSFIVSSLLYLIVIARGNVQHDYYQILIIPSIAIFMGLGVDFLIRQTVLFNKTKEGIVLFLIVTVFSFLFGWYFVRDYFNINNQAIVSAGKAVDALTSKEDKVIASYNGDTSFLYQTNRKGWASMEKSLPEMVQLGASYLVLVNPTSADLHLSTQYKIFKQDPDFVIFKLN
jgi:hypothetical protein